MWLAYLGCFIMGCVVGVAIECIMISVGQTNKREDFNDKGENNNED